jgi:hypothetical protein
MFLISKSKFSCFTGPTSGSSMENGLGHKSSIHRKTRPTVKDKNNQIMGVDHMRTAVMSGNFELLQNLLERGIIY